MSDDLPPGFPRLEDDQPPEIIRAPHPEVVRWVEYASSWPAGKTFPLTPLEAWYVLQGFTVKLAAAISFEEFLQLPGMIEGGVGSARLSAFLGGRHNSGSPAIALPTRMAAPLPR